MNKKNRKTMIEDLKQYRDFLKNNQRSHGQGNGQPVNNGGEEYAKRRAFMKNGNGSSKNDYRQGAFIEPLLLGLLTAIVEPLFILLSYIIFK